jgi:general secretion pathway protein G
MSNYEICGIIFLFMPPWVKKRLLARSGHAGTANNRQLAIAPQAGLQTGVCFTMNRSRFFLAAGFTLLEMLVVLVIIGLLAGMVGPRLFGHVDTAKVQTATAQVKLLRGAIETMRLDINVYPSQDQGLNLLVEQPTDPDLRKRWKGPYLESAVPLDPWGNPYYYQPPSTSGQSFLLLSLGADGKLGGDGLNADIGGDTLNTPAAPTGN